MALYHSARGSVDYTIVGSPTIVDNVLTDITANDYLSIGTYSGDTPTSIEIGSSFKTSNANIFSNAVIGRLTGADTGIFWGSSSFPGRLFFKHRVSYDNGTTWTAVESKSAALSLNTRYYVKFIISLAEQKLTGYVSTDNTNWTTYVANFNSGAILEGLNSIAIGKIYGHNASPLPIYLDYTYIKVNGKPWFGICPIEVNKHQLMGPVGYTVTGSPTITDGVASGFSNSNYLQISQTYNATNDKNVEIYVRAKTPTTISSSFNPIFGADNVGFWGISAYTNALFAIRMGYANGTSLDFGNMYISGGIQADTWYRFKITGSNGIWRAEIYNDSGTLLKSSDRDWTSNTLNANYTIKLKCTDNTNTYSGSIDLNETYIKVNGKLWYWQPRETERIIVNGVEVWTKPSPVITHGYTLTATRGTYAYTSQTFDLHNASSWSYNTRYKYLVAGQAGGQWLFGNSNGYYTGPMLLITSQNRLATYLSSTGSGFNIAQEKQLTDMTFEVNKEYLISLLYTDVDGYNFKVTDIATGHIYNFNVSTNTAHINNTAPTYFMNNMGGRTNSYNQGIMYLADTTIIVDGVKVFNGATAEIGVDLINNGLTIGEE